MNSARKSQSSCAILNSKSKRNAADRAKQYRRRSLRFRNKSDFFANFTPSPRTAAVVVSKRMMRSRLYFSLQGAREQRKVSVRFSNGFAKVLARVGGNRYVNEFYATRSLPSPAHRLRLDVPQAIRTACIHTNILSTYVRASLIRKITVHKTRGLPDVELD